MRKIAILSLPESFLMKRCFKNSIMTIGAIAQKRMLCAIVLVVQMAFFAYILFWQRNSISLLESMAGKAFLPIEYIGFCFCFHGFYMAFMRKERLVCCRFLCFYYNMIFPSMAFFANFYTIKLCLFDLVEYIAVAHQTIFFFGFLRKMKIMRKRTYVFDT